MTRKRLFWVLLAVLLLSFCAVSATTLIELRRDTQEQATTVARNLAVALSQEIGRSLERYDEQLLRIRKRLADADFASLNPSTQELALFDTGAPDPFLVALFTTDSKGEILFDRDQGAKARAGVSDQSYFTAQRDAPAAGLFVSEPFGQPNNPADQVVAMSRRLESPDGTFIGVAVGWVRVELFLRIMRGSALSPEDAINLFTRRGVLVARVPGHPNAIGRDMSQNPTVSPFLRDETGQITGLSPIDDVSRIYSFASPREAPIVLAVGLAEHNVFAAWNGRALTIGLVLLLLCALATALAFQIRHEFRRRLETEEVLRRGEEQYRLLADYSTDLIIRLDAGLTRRYVSPACRSMLGFEPEEMLGLASRSVIHPEDWPDVQRIAANARNGTGETESAYRLLTKNGDYVWVEGRYSYVPDDGGFIVVLRNITRRRKVEAELAAAHAELTDLAHTDPLTGLANRRRFDEALVGARASQRCAVLMMDVDRFKMFNDRYGHPAGDACLREVAAAIRLAVPGQALAARIGGEEFAVLLPAHDLAAAEIVAERIRAGVEARALTHEGNEANGGVVTVSVGCAERNEAGTWVEDADQMLYEAKRTGRNRVMSHLSLGGIAGKAPTGNERVRRAAIERFRLARLADGRAELDVLAMRLADTLGASIGFISLHGDEDVELVGCCNILPGSAPRAEALCSHAVLCAEPIVVADMAADPRFAGNPFVTPKDGLRFYAGAPLIDPQSGVPIGAVSVCDREPRYGFGPEQRTILTTFAHMVMHGL
ncbi:diguanylate cyclase domain-containing protein [Aureimonas ureilytica]|uniref:diguanylate cyclase domain-containing protein n=1 Tax=Aureimonas ureilytica TaxID=401562 RepID=UPI00037061E6|nr:diguanylate cyclase [Aureimonas ureilytica]